MNAAALLLMRQRAADLTAKLRAAVAEFGGDTPVSRITTTDTEVDTGYFGTVPNHVYRGLPSTTLLMRGDEIVAAVVERKEKGVEDAQLRSLKKLYSRRSKIIAETGTYPAAGTQLNATNPNDCIDTPIETEPNDR